jgi:NitT/TauT family transport system substrate-binding protein
MAAVCVLAAGTAACGGDDTEQGQAGGQAPVSLANATGTPEKTDVTIGFLPTPDSVTATLAIEKGFFEDEGLNVKRQLVKGGPPGIAALQSGALDVTQSSWPGFYLAEKQGIDLSVLNELSRGAENYLTLMATPESGAKTLEELRGKKIAVNTLASTCTLAVAKHLNEAGVDDSEVKFVEIPLPETPGAMQRGDVDAACLTSELTPIAEREVGAVAILDLFSGPTAGLPLTGWFSTAEFVRKNPNTAGAMQRGLIRAAEYARDNPAEVVELMTRHIEIPLEAAKKVTLSELMTTTDASEIDRNVELMAARGLIEPDVDTAELIGPR